MLLRITTKLQSLLMKKLSSLWLVDAQIGAAFELCLFIDSQYWIYIHQVNRVVYSLHLLIEFEHLAHRWCLFVEPLGCLYKFDLDLCIISQDSI